MHEKLRMSAAVSLMLAVAVFSASASGKNDATSSYMKNPAVPTLLNVISQDSLTPGEKAMVASLQGVVNGRCSSQIYTLDSSQPDYETWLEDLKNNHGVSCKVIAGIRSKVGLVHEPGLVLFAPTVFDLYLKSMTTEEVSNNFAVSPSGNGYMYPSKFDTRKLNAYVDELNDYMQKADEKNVVIIDDGAFNNMDLWNKFTEKPGIQGLFYLDYQRYDNYDGKILWSNNKPVASCRDLLWGNLENKDNLVKKINDRVDAGQVNPHTPEAYTFVYVHVWSKDARSVEEVERKLKQNPSVRIVTPETFMKLIKRNVKH